MRRTGRSGPVRTESKTGGRIAWTEQRSSQGSTSPSTTSHMQMCSTSSFWRQKRDLVVDAMDLCPIGESQITGVMYNVSLYDTPAEREFIRLWRRADGKEVLLVLKLETDDEIPPKIVLFGGETPEEPRKPEDFRNLYLNGILSSIAGDGKLTPMITVTV